MERPDPQDFEASALGTKAYWDTVYDRENTNFKEIGDIGEVWFGEDSVERMVDWVVDHIDNKQTNVLDLGCGNGHLLLALADEGFTQLTGIDYSPSAITLAASVAKEHDLGSTVIDYHTVDFLNDEGDEAWEIKKKKQESYQLVLDKGTFDAISLHPDQTSAKANGVDGPREAYVSSVYHLMDKDNGFLLITSCNWTMDELIDHFKNFFQYSSHVKYPTFSFGGHTGSKICTVAFKPLPTPLS
ncbi:S-adenosyl-L-methionine-dependent methyltransferase [Halteromyces radiatus]|uniref:S-adenosyl-L-methionine-dependent methyltransferase n=1 Tax=Halteromyces radiatus TaxID=101107 RepID=UPI00221ED61D|nr:S-adenosyl-L-methionine-dependent methyltransferase [Halteromyces radiatus]KAI8093184.1 S-adenosyl-L-methionine-dependent methyltransferase [Halteromyces radiatus]